MAELPRPYDILELGDGQRIALRIRGWSEGTIRIFPADWESRVNADLRRGAIDQAQAAALLRDGKPILSLRVVVAPGEKPTGMPYWDITSTMLAAQLRPYLEQAGYQAKTFTIQAAGVAPRKRFSLAVTPCVAATGGWTGRGRRPWARPRTP